MENFSTEFSRMLEAGARAFVADAESDFDLNYYSKGSQAVAKKSLQNRLLRSFGLRREARFADGFSGNLGKVLDNGPLFSQAYDMLGDDYSKSIFIRSICHRLLGGGYLATNISQSDFLKIVSESRRFLKKIGVDRCWKFSLDEYHKDNVSVICHEINFITTFMLEQYAYGRGGSSIQVEPGDIVVDGGGCFGDTAIYFAEKVGENGKVISYEFNKENLRVFSDNLKLNQKLAERVSVRQNGLWNLNDVKLSFNEDGPASTVSSGGLEGDWILSSTVDSLVQEGDVERVDFIKLDIEGAEMPALQGAEHVIAKFRPKLAIAVYHSLEDFFRIPLFIRSVCPEYRFFVDHYTPGTYETILYATAA